MNATRTFHGHYDHAVDKGRRVILWVALSREDGEELLGAIGRSLDDAGGVTKPHRSQSIPIALAIGRAAEVLAVIPPAPPEEPSAPEPAPDLPDIGGLIQRMAELTFKVAALTDQATAELDLSRRAFIHALRDEEARSLAAAGDELNAVMRPAILGNRA